MNQHSELKYSEQEMSETRSEEWISALLDGEREDSDAHRDLNRLGKDAAAAQAWSEYALIGDLMRNCATDSTALDRRLRAALAAEPTVLAPLARPEKNRQPLYWMAAAAAVAAISWSVLSVAPPAEPSAPMAASTATPALVADSNGGEGTNTGAVEVANALPPNTVMPYLAAHQDYAYAVVSEPEMRFTQVSLREVGR